MISINKKIRNATVVKSNKITFKSMLEKMCYNTLLEQGFNPQYEPFKIQLVDFTDSKVPFYDKETDKQQEKRRLLLGKNSPKLLVLKSDKMQPITYTPDFYLKYKNLDVWIEMKGKENDCFYLKKKLFRKYLDNILTTTGQKSIYFEVYSKKQLLQAIEIFKEYAEKS